MSSAAYAASFAYTDHDFARIAALIRREAGIHLEERKKDMVYARLASRLRALSVGNFAAYCDLLEDDGAEREIFISCLTTNVTAFFREHHHFDALASVLPQHTGSLMLWSAACSTGEEVYSMAMCAAHTLGETRDIKILATDIDRSALAKAKAGNYPADAFKNAPDYTRQFIAREPDGSCTVNDVIKRCISFKRLNLTQPWPMRKAYHAVFCRNVMIYFDNETTDQIMRRLGAITAPGGLLCIGHSENYVRHEADNFTRCGATAYRKGAV